MYVYVDIRYSGMGWVYLFVWSMRRAMNASTSPAVRCERLSAMAMADVELSEVSTIITSRRRENFPRTGIELCLVNILLSARTISSNFKAPGNRNVVYKRRPKIRNFPSQVF